MNIMNELDEAFNIHAYSCPIDVFIATSLVESMGGLYVRWGGDHRQQG
jgi:hypothetical protein